MTSKISNWSHVDISPLRNSAVCRLSYKTYVWKRPAVAAVKQRWWPAPQLWGHRSLLRFARATSTAAFCKCMLIWLDEICSSDSLCLFGPEQGDSTFRYQTYTDLLCVFMCACDVDLPFMLFCASIAGLWSDSACLSACVSAGLSVCLSVRTSVCLYH